MQLRHAVITVTGLCLAAVAIIWSGAQLAEPEPTFQADQTDIDDADALDTTVPPETEDEGSVENVSPAEPPAEPENSPSNDAAQPTVESATRANEDQEQATLPPQEELERLPPRPPLSELASAKSPTTAAPGESKSTRLFKPVASSAGTIEAQGYRIVLAGVDPTAADETCTFDGKQWPCGLQARTAFRSWLRGRAIACNVPPKPDQQPVVTECNIGKVDLSEWLVANGWAKASADGPYAEAGRKASEGKKGIYGPPSDKGGLNLPHLSDPAPLAFPQTESILQEPEPDPPPAIAQPPLTGTFPPAPQAPQ